MRSHNFLTFHPSSCPATVSLTCLAAHNRTMSQIDSKAIPQSPGVYFFKNKKGEVLYEGKAVNLRHRLKNYFGGPASSRLKSGLRGFSLPAEAGILAGSRRQVHPKIQALLARAQKVEWIETDNETEALLLENNLIKQHRPPFNVVLRDDKNYLYLKITLAEDYPRLLFARRPDHSAGPGQAGARFFGPYTSSRDLRRTLSLLKKIFPLCSANYEIREADMRSGKQRKKPCLNYHLGRCLGPCVGEVTSNEYRKVIAEVMRFLAGDYKGALLRLDNEMEKAAQERRFERAAYWRDQKRSLLRLMEEQKVVLPNAQISRDIFGLARALSQVVVAILVVRQGRLLDQKLVAFEDRFKSGEGEILEQALYDYYQRTEDLPKEVVLPVEVGESFRLWLGQKAGRKVKFNVPKYGPLKKMVELAGKNAAHQLFALSRHLTQANLEEEMAALRQLLKVKRLSRIEAYDISHLAGTNAVGSMVVFLDGLPAPAHYRRFKIKLAKPADDFGAILEVLKRRFKYPDASYQLPVAAKDASFAACPNLVVVDGGKPQLSAALTALKSTSSQSPVPSFKFLALAKKQEEIFVPGRKKSIKLPVAHPARRLLQRIRDEAHRFAVSYHTQLRRQAVSSVLERVPGVGAKTRKKLIKAFGSLSGVKKASLGDISKVVGLSKAKTIQDALA